MIADNIVSGRGEENSIYKTWTEKPDTYMFDCLEKFILICGHDNDIDEEVDSWHWEKWLAPGLNC